MSRRVPLLKSDEEAQAFLDQDLSDLDFAKAPAVWFQLKPKERALTLRLSSELFDAVKRAAREQGIPYVRLIRNAVERAVMPERAAQAMAPTDRHEPPSR